MFISQNSVSLFQGARSTALSFPSPASSIETGFIRLAASFLTTPETSQRWRAVSRRRSTTKKGRETKSRCCQRLKKQRTTSCLATKELPEKIIWEFPDFHCNVKYWCTRLSFSSTLKYSFLCLFLISQSIQRIFLNACAYEQTVKHKAIYDNIFKAYVATHS